MRGFIKTVLLSALMICSTAQASDYKQGTVAYTTNDRGGRIELMNITVPASAEAKFEACKGRYIAKTWAPDVADTFGCWTLSGDTILVFWLTGQGVRRTYFFKNFTVIQRSKNTQ